MPFSAQLLGHMLLIAELEIDLNEEDWNHGGIHVWSLIRIALTIEWLNMAGNPRGNGAARRLALVALHRWLGVQGTQPPQAQVFQGPDHCGELSGQQPGDVAQVQPLMA